jgi:hypothetical protein
MKKIKKGPQVFTLRQLERLVDRYLLSLDTEVEESAKGFLEWLKEQ